MGQRFCQAGWRSVVGEFKLSVVKYTGWSHKVAHLVSQKQQHHPAENGPPQWRGARGGVGWLCSGARPRVGGEVVVDVGCGGASVRVQDIFGTESDSGMCR